MGERTGWQREEAGFQGKDIRLLQEDGEIEKDLTLRQIYDKYFQPSVLPINEDKYWKVLQENKVINIFQFDADDGRQAAKKIKPRSILEMSDANGLMRLMTGEKGGENPIDKYVRFKNNINLWYDEMTRYGLTQWKPKLKNYVATEDCRWLSSWL